MGVKKAPRSPSRSKAGALQQLVALLLTGIIIDPAKGAPHVVNGIVGGATLLSVMVPHNFTVVEVRWKFGSTKVRLGDSKGREFVPFMIGNVNYGQLIQRLDMYNETTLRIRNLAKSDSSVYEADVQFNDASSKNEAFQLCVYDPVPIPHIEKISLGNTSDVCNLTLVCEIPSAEDVRISWAILNHTEALILVQNNSDGKKLNLSINTETSTNVYYEYFCFATNPAEQKNASIADVCPMRPQSHQRFRHGMAYAAIPIITILAVMFYLYFCKRKKKKMERKHEACTKVELPETGSADLHYADVTLDNAEGNDQYPRRKAQRPIVPPTQTSMPTIYVEVCVH